MPDLFNASYPFTQETGNNILDTIKMVFSEPSNEIPGINAPVNDYTAAPNGMNPDGSIRAQVPGLINLPTRGTPVANNQFPAMQQPPGKVTVGNIQYSSNNPYLSKVPQEGGFLSKLPFKMSTKWHERAQAWEDQNMQRQMQAYNFQRQQENDAYNFQRQRENDAFNRSQYTQVTKELLGQLDPTVASVLREGQYVRVSDINNVLKTNAAAEKTQREQAAWQGMQLQAEELLSKIPDDAPEKLGLIAQMQQAIRLQDYNALDKANVRANDVVNSISKRGVDAATVTNKNASTNKLNAGTEKINYELNNILPLTVEEKKTRIEQIKSSIAKNMAQINKIRTGGGTSGKNNKLVSFLTSEYKLYLSEIGKKASVGEIEDVKSFNEWIKSNDWSSGGKRISGDQMLALYNQELTRNVDLSGIPDSAPPSGAGKPTYKSSNLFTKNDWDYIDKEVRKRGSVRKTIFDLLKANRTTEGQAQALANRFGMSLNELMSWYDKNKPKKK